MNCINKAWDKHEKELRQYLQAKSNNLQVAEDILQDTFVKALSHQQYFCQLDNTRAWLYKVANNTLIDFYRTHKQCEDILDVHPQPIDNISAVVNLSQCLPHAIKMLSNDEQEIIQSCDLDGLKQYAYAKQRNISLSNTKSRLLRARKQLKLALNRACEIVLDEQGRVCCFESTC